jgi:hypothetical protein
MPKRTPVTTLRDADGREYPFKLLTASTAKAAMRPYAAEVGLLANAWNHLHHNLSLLFALLLRAPNPYAGQALWHSLESDVLQRKILRALIEADEFPVPPEYKQPLTPTQAKEILYVLNEIDRPLRGKRNNAIHAPLVLFSGIHRNAARTWAEAHFDSQNPRARPLRGLDLIEEFRDYTAELERLSKYIGEMWSALNPLYAARHPWPQRPLVPRAHNKKRSGRRGIPRLPAHRLKA